MTMLFEPQGRDQPPVSHPPTFNPRRTTPTTDFHWLLVIRGVRFARVAGEP